MKPVSMQELTDWVEKNKNHTWYMGDGGGYDAIVDPDKPGSIAIKYLTFSLDTRDMKVYHVNAERLGVKCDFRDPGEGTILDKLDGAIQEYCARVSKERVLTGVN